MVMPVRRGAAFRNETDAHGVVAGVVERGIYAASGTKAFCGLKRSEARAPQQIQDTIPRVNPP